MLTPQEISEKGFVKAVFGGYDMEGVDEFLEAVSNDYNALYKENAILKGKLKVLVEKVEEYRSTEDAMRMALLTAQRMGEEITVEAKRTKDEMLLSAEHEIKIKLSDTAERIADEDRRLAVATKETAKFIDLSLAIMRKHAEFLDKLEAARRTVAPKGEAKQAPQGSAAQAVPAQPAKSRSAKQAPPAKAAGPATAQPVAAGPATVQPIAAGPVAVQPMPTQPVNEAPLPTPAPQPGPAQQAAAQPVSAMDMEIDDIASQIGSIVGQITAGDPMPPVENISAPTAPTQYTAPAPPVAPTVPVSPVTFDAPPSSLFEDDDGPVKPYTPDDELENTSPRPKFDFDDLKFGANFDSDD